MNWVDFFLIAIFLVSLIAGWYKGFIRGSLGLLSWIGSFVLAYTFYPYTAKGLARISDLDAWLLPVAFILTLVIFRLLTGLLLRYFVKAVPEHADHSTVNKFLGIIPGAINGLITAIIISALLLSLPMNDRINEETRDSRLAGPLAMQAEWTNRKLAPVFDQAVRQTMNSLTVHPGSHEKVELSFTYDKAEVRPFLEAKMLELVNEERIKNGLNALQPDPELTKVARAHSQDMFVKGYFAHVNLEGKDPFDRMRAAHVQFRSAGENLALAQTLEIAHTNLMNSPGHRANILNPAFGRLGIGIWMEVITV